MPASTPRLAEPANRAPRSGPGIGGGLALALLSAFAFGAGGAIVKPLLEAGWSPGAAVFARVLTAAIVLAVPTLLVLRFDLRPVLRAWRIVLAYGLVSVAITQFAFYAAIERIPVSIGLLVEYLAPVVLVAWAWARTRRMPQFVVLAGAVVAVAGLVLVIGPGGGALDPIGLALAGVATLGLAVYFVIGERADAGLPPLALAGSGFVVGAAALGLMGASRLLPFRAEFVDVDFLGLEVPWWMPVLAVGILSTAFAYSTGIAAIRRLGTRLASFVGLSEVVFAAVVSWWLLGEALGLAQLAGGALIVAGIVLVRLERPRPAVGAGPASDAVPAPGP
ncbi:EamA family transporter [Agromyces archimandritae]|uniref:EamA family transporter n=1 Tax=Agromyces archimandritae TaxID=2781962 RepID=A0A975FP46_9MICO|nr:EamA family transporter [Agromyces archimandritae]QTX05068.1 EamA family transporter [Agromyces archimandritae]